MKLECNVCSLGPCGRTVGCMLDRCDDSGSAINPSWREVKEEPESKVYLKDQPECFTWTDTTGAHHTYKWESGYLSFDCPGCKEKDGEIERLNKQYYDLSVVASDRAYKLMQVACKDKEIDRLSTSLANMTDLADQRAEENGRLKREIRKLKESGMGGFVAAHETMMKDMQELTEKQEAEIGVLKKDFAYHLEVIGALKRERTVLDSAKVGQSKMEPQFDMYGTVMSHDPGARDRLDEILALLKKKPAKKGAK